VGIAAAVLIATRPDVARKDDLAGHFDEALGKFGENVEQYLGDAVDHGIEMGTPEADLKG
jgi:hypothetical protein